MERVSLIAAAATVSLMSAGMSPAAVIFNQDFSGSTDPNSYESTTPNSSQFNDVGADGTTNTMSVVNDDIVFDMNTSGNSGLTRSTNLLDSNSQIPTVLAIEFVFTYTRNSPGSGPGPNLQIGNYNSVTAYTGGGTSNDRFDDLFLRRGSGTTFQVEINDPDSVTAGNQSAVTGLQFGQQYTVLYLLNNSGSSEDYVGPDGNEYTLNTGRAALFVGTQLGANNVLADDVVANATADLSGFRFRMIDAYSTIALDRFTISDTLPVPEPASLSMLAIGGLMALRRRSR